MSAPQFMPFYIGDYLADTQHLTTEQHGAYLLLLFACWSMAKLPDDDGKLMAIAHCESMAKWRKLRKTLEPFFKISHGYWEQKRLKKERKIAQKIADARSEAGQKGALSRWRDKVKTDNGKANGSAYGKTMAEPCPSSPFPQTPFSLLPPQPQPDSHPPLTPPSPARGGGRGRARSAKKSPRTVQTEAFYHAALDSQRSHNC